MTGSPTTLRLLSPNQRLIVRIDRSNPRHVTRLAQLSRFGWKVYTGPAETNDRGWVIPGTDPQVLPVPYDTKQAHR